MKTQSISKTKNEKGTDPAWEEIKAGLESALHGKLTVWKHGSKIK